jgi:hypothetical protein
MSTLWALILVLASAQGEARGRSAPQVSGPTGWIAFAADVRINYPNRPEAWGRYVQDEHGCQRQEMVHPDGSAMITIMNFETGRFYRLMRGTWTSQAMKVGPMTRQPLQRRVNRRTDPVEGFDAYIIESTVRSPRGDYVSVETVVPALNFFRAITTSPFGERRTAANIRVGPQTHDQFLPPPGAAVAEEPGYAGTMFFSAVVLRLSFAGQASVEATTTEETAYAVKTPSGIPLTLVTTIVDPAKNLVRIRVLASATGSPGNVRGDLLDEIQVPLGGTGQTTRFGEPLTIAVTRVGTATR